jgi:hypothetical protein
VKNARQEVLLDFVLGPIGNTPLVELSRVRRGLEGRLLAKVMSFVFMLFLWSLKIAYNPRMTKHSTGGFHGKTSNRARA